MTERKPNIPLNNKVPFDITDHYAMLTGLELTKEQLYKAKEKKGRKVPTKPDLSGSDPLVKEWNE